jgi:hypothetical protein
MASVVLDERVEEGYDPSQEEVEEYAKWIGMVVEEDQAHMWIAREGLMVRPQCTARHWPRSKRLPAAVATPGGVEGLPFSQRRAVLLQLQNRPVRVGSSVRRKVSQAIPGEPQISRSLSMPRHDDHPLLLPPGCEKNGQQRPHTFARWHLFWAPKHGLWPPKHCHWPSKHCLWPSSLSSKGR